MAARWAAHESFHKAVVARHRSYKKAKHQKSKSGERNASASKGVSSASSESDAQTLSESADEWNKFCRAADEAAAAASIGPNLQGRRRAKAVKAQLA